MHRCLAHLELGTPSTRNMGGGTRVSGTSTGTFIHAHPDILTKQAGIEGRFEWKMHPGLGGGGTCSTGTAGTRAHPDISGLLTNHHRVVPAGKGRFSPSRKVVERTCVRPGAHGCLAHPGLGTSSTWRHPGLSVPSTRAHTHTLTFLTWWKYRVLKSGGWGFSHTLCIYPRHRLPKSPPLPIILLQSNADRTPVSNNDHP